ncbi:MAG TPA: hypothetical protein VJM76_04570 [Gammaproteobacteria bacterium]|nr:hypothetical protein [Gammaproteobacteria bacterium]
MLISTTVQVKEPPKAATVRQGEAMKWPNDRPGMVWLERQAEQGVSHG